MIHFQYSIFIKIICIFCLYLTLSCNQKQSNNTSSEDSEQKEIFQRDLDEIREDGKLRALIIYSSTSYFLYRGRAMGYEYEQLKRLAKSLDLELELHVAQNIDSLFIELEKGTADIVAHGLTITRERKKRIQFTEYLYLTRQVLVQKKPDNWHHLTWSALQKSLVRDPLELINDTISVRENTSYFERIGNLSKEIGGPIYIDTIRGNVSTDKIIDQVVKGTIKYTIADEYIAKINASYYPILDVSVPVSFSQRIAWAMRPTSPKLLKAVDTWIQKERKEVDYHVIYNKYFENKRTFKQRIKSDFYSLNKNQISKYDDIIKKHAQRIGWDWRLLTSLIYQESRFDPEAASWAGARGLMQLMPETAKELGVTSIFNEAENIRAGTNYLQQLYNNFDEITDTIQRTKFAMASYNCGYYHVIDAQKLAEIKGYDKHKWDGHVEEMILDLSYPENYKHRVVKYGYVRGIEPFTYVKQIFQRYKHYTNFIKK
ncbi:MAG: transporter substrate-binding domain-containing protein [Bacteroidales bacterium]|jgi:membrane-bound lytic murein transglycosylase F|nr:transporter substrate-binding domain-containing protein [Bacteroidales bacterium]